MTIEEEMKKYAKNIMPEGLEKEEKNKKKKKKEEKKEEEKKDDK